MEPPSHVVDKVIEMAGRSGCLGSARGAVVFDPHTDALYFGGWNGPPAGRVCDASVACNAECGRRCVHAEARALRLVYASSLFGDAGFRGEAGLAHPDLIGRLELVHGRAVDNRLVATGGPSCWQCSREVLDSGIAAVWLYTRGGVEVEDAPGGARQHRTPDKWIRWPAVAFDEETRRVCKVH